ncbi:MAG: lipoyl(octanoyl) transferase LipB [Deltaproteobacteria bacterium]|nr:lipoyl(octanoyl) transferase LipB [Deltaproteobacteria bacterium]
MTLRRVDFVPTTRYQDVYAAMQDEATKIARGELPETFWIGDHATTVTLGRSLKSQSQLLASPSEVNVVEVERGGGATMHNPGQLVVYPLIRLDTRRLSPVTYLRELERVIIDGLAMDGIEARAEEGKTGVWVGPRKIASLGVSLIEGVTRHGLAVNVSNDLKDFALITPCGFSADTMVRVQSYRREATFDEYKERFAELVVERFSLAS